MEKKNIVLTCDTNYLRYLLPCLASIKENVENYQVHLIIDNTWNEKEINMVKEIDKNVNFIDIHPYLDKYLPNIEYKNIYNTYFSIATCYRLLIPKIFPNLDKALYIDADTIVVNSLDELFYNFQLNQYIAVDNLYEPFIDRKKIQDINKYLQYLGIKEKEKVGFNAGITLFNLTKIKKDKLDDNFIEDCKKYINIFFAIDQDILIKNTKGKVNTFGLYYNYLNDPLNTDLIKRYKEYERLKNEIKIYHLVKKPKKVRGYFNNPHYKLYLKYYQKTPLRYNKLQYNLIVLWNDLMKFIMIDLKFQPIFLKISNNYKPLEKKISKTLKLRELRTSLKKIFK